MISVILTQHEVPKIFPPMWERLPDTIKNRFWLLQPPEIWQMYGRAEALAQHTLRFLVVQKAAMSAPHLISHMGGHGLWKWPHVPNLNPQ